MAGRPAINANAAREILSFYVEAGVDVALVDVPVDRFADAAFGDVGFNRDLRQDAAASTQQAPEPPPFRDPVPAPNRGGATPINPDAAVMAARAAAAHAATLEELRGILQGFEGCALRHTAKQLVFADGNPRSRVMFVGEAPGRDEDLEGLPFVGRSGRLLDRMMAAVGLDRSSVYIANIIPWRPPGNRTPTPQEAAICLPFIRRQIELTDAEILVCLGGPSAQALLGVKDGILKMRGRWFPHRAGTRDIRALATLHPAYLLRQPLQKRLAWRDFLSIKAALDGPRQSET